MMRVSFEFFPPRTPEMEVRLWECVQKLAALSPAFVSVTYGAGGSTRARTHATIERIVSQTQLIPAAHLTCVDASKQEVLEVARQYWQAGVRHIVALRGDCAEGRYSPHPEGFATAAELVAGLKQVGEFEISVAAYPETHPEAASAEADLDNLKRKIDAGATRAITQYFFDTDVYFRFLERVRKAGITVPVIPGILPVSNVGQVMKFSALCGASVPAWLSELFAGLDDDPVTRNLVAAHVAADQCRALQKGGVNEFHFYTLNRAELTRAICHVLGVRVSQKHISHGRFCLSI